MREFFRLLNNNDVGCRGVDDVRADVVCGSCNCRQTNEISHAKSFDGFASQFTIFPIEI